MLISLLNTCDYPFYPGRLPGTMRNYRSNQRKIGRVGWSVLESRNNGAQISRLDTKYEGCSKFLYVDFKLNNNVKCQFLIE